MGIMTHRLLRLSAAIGAVALAVGIGCSASEPAPEEPAPEPAAQAEPPPPPPAPEAPKKPLTIQAATPEMERIAQELARGGTRDEQQRRVASQQHYEVALRYHDKGDFEKARVEAEKALQVWPENLAARKLLADIQQMLVGGRAEFGARSIADQTVQAFRVQIEQAQIEIARHIREGERYFNARMYDEAIREFENAEFKIVHIPYEVKAMNELLPRVREAVVKARNAKIEEEKRVEEEKRKMAEAEAMAHDIAYRREVTRKIAHLLELAYMAFDQKKFDRCAKLCDEILLIDPHYTVAKELKEDAQRTRHKEEYFNILAKKVEHWKQLTDDDEEAVIPYSQTVRFPSREEWAEISKRITESVIKTEGGTRGEEDPDILAIERKLDTMKIDLAFEDTKLQDILDFIRDFSGLNIHIDGAVLANIDPNKTFNFKLKDATLRNVLKILLSQVNLDYRITEEKVVLITDPKSAGGGNVLELHDIRDILVKLQDFAGPKVELVSPSAQGGGALTGATFTLDEPKESSVGEEQIVDLIKENIAPNTWEGDQTIEKTPNQQLLVNAPPKVHRELREFLGKLRSYTGTMVSVTCRFVAAYDDFLDDVGVDIINRANQSLPGIDYTGVGGLSQPNTPSINEPSAQIGPGFTTNESARLESYDLRAQTFHTLLRFDPLTGIGIDPLQNRLVSQGGLGLQYQWIGEQALQIALRALHKGLKATLVQAPRVTVFNTQRSHVMFLTQVAYIQDYEPQVSTLAAAYDPIIGILTHGVVLDVRPIVSNDRKYVTLELKPSLAQLQTMRTVNIRPGLNILLQLPWVVLQKAETTVQIPDRGTLIISGFKDLFVKDMQSGVPFLEHIPVLNFFFTRKAKADERRRLLMLVTPEIIDLAEHEDRQF
jgi:type II secretory pathway component GspD/PulD (secretin)/tetratricopeptide (TPR) repeat protein